MPTADAKVFDPKSVSLLWAGPERAAEIAAVHTRLFEPPWDEASVRQLLDHPASMAFVAWLGQAKATVGFILGQLAADEAEILSVGVDAECQRRGVGRLLVEGLARAARRAEARRLYLEVATDNAGASALYRGLGFEEVGRRKAYYCRAGAPSVDAIILALAL